MKSKEVLFLAVCLTTMAPVAQAQSTTPTADPQAQSLKGFYNSNKRVTHYFFKDHTLRRIERMQNQGVSSAFSFDL